MDREPSVRRKSSKVSAVFIVGAGLSTLVFLTACGLIPGQSATSRQSNEPQRESAQPVPSATQEAQTQPTGGGADLGGQNKPTGYTDARYNYRITGPGPLSARSDGTASFVGEDERLQVAVVQDEKAANPLALAQSDVSSLGATSAGFRTVSGPATVTLGGQNMVKVTFAWTGKSQAAGTQLKKTGVRYYIPKSPSTLAVVHYEDASGEFDQREADGFAGSFRWL
jgi:hypothetical protein